MKTRNEVFITGRIGRDPESKTFDNGGSITKLNVATENNYKNKSTDEWVKETEWHNVIVKGSKARDAQRLRKGDMVSLTGRLKTRGYETNGQKKWITEIHTYEATLAEAQHEGEVNGNRVDNEPWL